MLAGYKRTCDAIDRALDNLNVRIESNDAVPTARQPSDGSYLLSEYAKIVRAADGSTQSLDLSGLATSIQAYPALIDVATLEMPGSAAVEVKLPRPLVSDCSTEAYPPTLENREISRALTIQMPQTGQREALLHTLCSKIDGDAEPPYLLLKAITFKGPVRIIFPPEPSLGLAITADRFLSSLEIVGSKASAPKLPSSVLPLPRLTINASALEGDTYIGNIKLSAIDVYFNTTRSFSVSGAKIDDEISIHDNQMGPFRFRDLKLPGQFLVDANRIYDSMYLTEAHLPVRPIQGQSTRPSLLHNQIDGNLIIALHTDKEGENQESHGLRVAGMAVGGSAYISIGDLISECQQRSHGSPESCDQSDNTEATPAKIEIVDSRITSRLVFSLADLRVQHTGSSTRVLTPRAPGNSAVCSSKAINIDLTGTTVGVFSWNLPECAVNGTKFTWSGQKFSFGRFEARELAGNALIPIEESAVQELGRLEQWASRYNGKDRGEVYARLETYMLATGSLFRSWSMKGTKVKSNIDAIWPDLESHPASPAGSASDSAPGLLTSQAIAATSTMADDAVESRGTLPRPLRYVLNLHMYALYLIVWTWGLPTYWGKYPQLAVLFLLIVVAGSALIYRWYSTIAESKRWPRCIWARSQADDDQIAATSSWSALRGKRHPHGWYSNIPGFLQRDERPWQSLTFLFYSLDCTIPLIQLGYRQEYQPLHDGTWRGDVVSWLPVIQLVWGIWLGSWAMALFFV